MTKRKKKHLPESQGVDDFLDQARKLDQTGYRKQHLVPQSYLSRWAVDGQIRVTETSTSNSFITSPVKAAKETDFYRVDSPELDPDFVPPLLFEKALSEFEGKAQPALDV